MITPVLETNEELRNHLAMLLSKIKQNLSRHKK
ncbi:MAG: hypothetical protein K0Q73_243 [Paenibacillus sp.]|nr:hypothetical protein [Paenibacillus sp.]